MKRNLETMGAASGLGLAASALVALTCGGGAEVAAPALSPTSGDPHAHPSAAQDPAHTDPDNYKAVFENDRVRVLRYHDTPGTETHPHRHPDMVMIALSSFRRRLSFPDGSSREVEIAAGSVSWVGAQAHVGANVGTTDTEVLLVEMKR